MKKAQQPNSITCPKCSRLLSIERYAGYGAKDQKPENTTRIKNNTMGGISIFCPCGHLTEYFSQ